MSVFTSLLKVVGGLTAGFTLFARSITESGNQVNKFVNTLVILKGNTAAAKEELQFLFELSNKLGTSFTAAATPFTKFAAAAAGTISDQSIRDVFESFTTVGVALQLTQSEITGVFLALQQIASKGVVSMEELRLQLAERIPGAMRIAAESMGMTLDEFEDAVANRTINAGEFLENFAASLKEVFGLAAELASERLFADIQRLGNAFAAFRQKVFASGFQEGLTNLVRSATNFLNNNPELAEALGRFSEGIFNRVAQFLDSLTADRVIFALNALIGAFEALVNVLNTVAFQIRKLFDDDFDDATSQVEEKINSLNSLIRQRNQITTDIAVRSQTTGSDDGILGGPISEGEISAMQSKLDVLNDKIFIAREELISAKNAAKEFGIQLGQLPDDLFGRIEGDIGPLRVELPRIEFDPSADRSGSSLDLSNQPPLEGQRGDVLNALGRADKLLSETMPEFFDTIRAEELRNEMDTLIRLQLDYNTKLEEQRLLMEKIQEKEQLIAELRDRPEDIVQSAELNNEIQKQQEALDEYKERQQEVFELEQDINDELERRSKLTDKFKTFQEELEETFTSVRDAIINSIKKIEDTIVDFVATGEFNFKQLADSIIRELTRIAVQAFLTRYILGPLLGGASDALGAQLGGTFAEPGPGIPGAHTGGIVGSSTLKERSSFDKMRANEQPIIALKGEGIFTKEQMRAMAPLSAIKESMRKTPSQVGPAMVSAPTVNVRSEGPRIEVINNSGAESQVETIPQTDGSELTRIIIGTVSRNIAADGDISKLMKGKFGLKQRTGIR
jgi:tape measure domain-containing protein